VSCAVSRALSCDHPICKRPDWEVAMSKCHPQVAATGQRVLAFDSSEVPHI
jgi:hypothetical protein